VGRLSIGLLIVTGLLLTACFGLLAWRISDDKDLDITGGIPHDTYGWKPRSANLSAAPFALALWLSLDIARAGSGEDRKSGSGRQLLHLEVSAAEALIDCGHF
jgi:hypothetical protein